MKKVQMVQMVKNMALFVDKVAQLEEKEAQLVEHLVHLEVTYFWERCILVKIVFW